MPVEFTETVEEFAFAGPFSPGVLVALGAALVAVVCVLARRDGRFTGTPVAVLLAVLRIAAVVVVLWMLSEPTLVTKVRTTRPDSVALLADTSASMGIVEPFDDADTAARWASYGGSSTGGLPFADLDGACAAVRACARHLESFSKACRGAANLERATYLGKLAGQAIESAVEHLEHARSRIPDPASGDGKHINIVASDLRNSVLPELPELVDEIASKGFIDRHRRVRLGKLKDTVGRLARRLDRAVEGLSSSYVRLADAGATTPSVETMRLSRVERAAGLLEEMEESWLRDLDGGVRVVRYGFHQAPFQIPPGQWSHVGGTDFGTPSMATDLAAALERISRDAAGRSLAAAVLVSDGGHNTERDPLKLASAMSVPVYIVPVGNINPVKDVVLHHVQAPRAAFLNDMIVVEATVDAYECLGEELQVEMLTDGAVVDRATVPVTSDTFAGRLKFVHKAEKLGVARFRLRVHPLPREHLDENNVAEVSVEVVEDTLRVLLADHMPRWEYRYLRNLFKRDEHVEFSELLIEPFRDKERRPAEGRGFPANLDGWGLFRVVILGDIAPWALGESGQDMLQEYVSSRGGTLVVIAGDNAMPEAFAGEKLEKMLPIDLHKPSRSSNRGYQLLLTEEGRATSALRLADDALASERVWREMGGRLPIYSLSPYAHAKPTSHVLVSAAPIGSERPQSEDEQAFLCWHQYGKGRVVYLAAPVTYRFRYRHGDLYHHRFWGQLLRWAIAGEMAGGSRTVRLMTDKMRYEAGDDVQVTARLSHPTGGAPVVGAACQVSPRIGRRLIGSFNLTEDKDDPGVYRGVLKGLPAGSVTISAEGADVRALLEREGYQGQVETVVTVDPAGSLELRNTRCNLPLLKEIAESTGGQLLHPTGLRDVVSLLDLWPERSETVTRRPLWARWWLLWVFLGCLAVEWIVRKLAGLA